MPYPNPGNICTKLASFTFKPQIYKHLLAKCICKSKGFLKSILRISGIVQINGSLYQESCFKCCSILKKKKKKKNTQHGRAVANCHFLLGLSLF